MFNIFDTAFAQAAGAAAKQPVPRNVCYASWFSFSDVLLNNQTTTNKSKRATRALKYTEIRGRGSNCCR